VLDLKVRTITCANLQIPALTRSFLVDAAIARNCTNISPCQQDTTIIRDAEINANIVNECGRTELSGNIDVGEETENALSAKAVTQVTAGMFSLHLKRLELRLTW